MKLVIALVFLFFIACSSSSQIDPQQNTNSKTKNEPQKNKSDDELLNLLEGSKNDKKTTKNDSNNVKQDKSNQQTDTSRTSLTVENKEDSKLKQRLNQLETEITNKNNTINQLSTKVNDLENENIELKNKKTEIIVSAGSGQVISDEEYESHYKNAYELFQNRNYSESIKVFENLIANNSSHKYSANAQYWIGECRFALKSYQLAILDFEKVFTFSNSNKHEDSQFKIAYSYYMLKDKANAKIEFERFLNKYPKSRNADRARKMMNE